MEFKPFEAVDGLMPGSSLQKMIADIKKVTTEEALKEKHAQLMAAIPLLLQFNTSLIAACTDLKSAKTKAEKRDKRAIAKAKAEAQR